MRPHQRPLQQCHVVMNSQTQQPSSWFSFGRVKNHATNSANCTSVPDYDATRSTFQKASPQVEQDTCNDDDTKQSCGEQSKLGMVLKGNSSISILSYCRHPQPKSTVIVVDFEEHAENDSGSRVDGITEIPLPTSSSIRQQRSNSLPSSLSPGVGSILPMDGLHGNSLIDSLSSEMMVLLPLARKIRHQILGCRK